MLAHAYIQVPADWTIRINNFLTCMFETNSPLDDLMWFTETLALYYGYRLFIDNNDTRGIHNAFVRVLSLYDQPWIEETKDGFALFEETFLKLQHVFKYTKRNIDRVEFYLQHDIVQGLLVWYDDDI